MSDGTIGTLLIIGSVFFDVLANICLKKSQGFKYKLYGFLAISLVGFAFLCLAYAISIMDLSIAYALFGACGLLLTTIIDTPANPCKADRYCCCRNTPLFSMKLYL